MTYNIDERKRVYESTRADLFVRQVSNSERYDNAILTLSAGILGVSIAFIKDVIPLKGAINIWVLKWSWGLFSGSIVSTLLSFVMSQWAISKQLKYADKYYLQGDDSYINKKNWPGAITDFLNIISGVIFVSAIIATVCFVTTNLSGGEKMSEKQKVIFIKDGQTVNLMQRLEEGTPIPPMQKVPGKLERGIPVPTMQPIPPPAPSKTTGTDTSAPSTGNKSKN